MTPDQKDQMRNQIAEYSKAEFIELAIGLQDAIDGNMRKIRGLEQSQEQMTIQNTALTTRNEELEDQADAGANPEELQALQDKLDTANEKIEKQLERIDRLTELNEKLQERLIAD